MERQRMLPEIDSGVLPALTFAAQSGEDQALDELSRKMLSWSRLWFGSSGNCAPAEDNYLVRGRLLSWLERCIGRQAHGVLTSCGEDVSPATYTPLLTALLGRRATREILRRVLDDL